MNRQHLRAIATYYNVNDYYTAQQYRQRVNDANPALLTTLSERDPNTGESLAATASGGGVRLSGISSGGFPAGSVIPSSVISGRGGFADWRPGT